MPDPDHRRKGPRAACTPVLAALLCAGAGLVAGCATSHPRRPVAAAAHPLQPLPAPIYPATKRDRQLDVYHGVAVADPWRWLEGLETPAVHQWVAAENALSRPYLATLPLSPLLRPPLKHLPRNAVFLKMDFLKIKENFIFKRNF